VEYVYCGHVQPLSILGSVSRRLEESNLVVGLIPGASYASTHCMLRRGERLLLVTDGITEAENEAGMQFGDTGLIAIAHHDDVGSILDQVAKFHAPNEAEDDCTLVDIQYTGQAASGGLVRSAGNDDRADFAE
jgi:phosphoserine phosphatase RsbU/P